eukprot:463040-Amphidinium_carterae.1
MARRHWTPASTMATMVKAAIARMRLWSPSWSPKEHEAQPMKIVMAATANKRAAQKRAYEGADAAA